MNDDFGPTIKGVTIPETVILPPEVIQLLPWMSLAELKITIAAVARLMQVGGAEPITLSEFEMLTGLARASVVEGIERSMQRGLLTRFEISGYQGHLAYVYEIQPRFIGSKIEPMKPVKDKPRQAVVDESESTTNLNLTGAAAENLTADPGEARRNDLYARLRKIGIYPKTAANLLRSNDPARVEQFLGLYPLAVQAGRAAGPGWLVTAVTDASWDPAVEQADLEERLADRRTRQAEPAEAPAPAQGLPQKVLAALRQIGWNGDTAEVLEAYTRSKKLVRAWLEWAATQPPEYQAARFRNGLRSGQMPPASGKRRSASSRRYVAGKYGEYINH